MAKKLFSPTKWQLAFPHEWDGTPATGVLLEGRYIRYCQELNVPIGDVTLATRGKILKENLMLALLTAIEVQTQQEKKAGYTGDSALVTGWKNNLAILRKGGTLEIK